MAELLRLACVGSSLVTVGVSHDTNFELRTDDGSGRTDKDKSIYPFQNGGS